MSGKNWRPRTATDVPLDDRQLAQLGLLAAMETTCFAHVATALKAVEHLDYHQWMRLDALQFRQVAERLQRGAEKLDPVLLEIVNRVIDQQDVLILRHQHLHSLWAQDEDDSVTAWDLRRDKHLPAEGLTAAVERVAGFTYITKDCLHRVADLLAYGELPSGQDGPGPQVYWRGGWRKF